MIKNQNNLKNDQIFYISEYSDYFNLLPLIVGELDLPERLIDGSSYLLEKILKTPFAKGKNPLIFTLICIYYTSNRSNYEITFRYLFNKYKNPYLEKNFLKTTIKYYKIFLKEMNLTHPKSYLNSMIKRFFRDMGYRSDSKVQEMSLMFAQNIQFKDLFDNEFKRKSNSLIATMAIYFVSQYRNLFIPVEEIYNYFKIPYCAFIKFRKVIDKKYNDIEKILSKDPDDIWLEFLFC